VPRRGIVGQYCPGGGVPMGRRKMVAPLPQFHWAARSVDADRIDEELDRLWGDEVRRSEQEGVPPPRPGRALNLVVHTASPREAEQVATQLEQLGPPFPARTIILLARPHLKRAGLDAWVDARVRSLPGSDHRMWIERVAIAARGPAAEHLPSTVDPLLDNELPDFLWWPDDPPFGTSRFVRLLDLVDRLIVDSAGFSNPAGAFGELARLAGPGGVAVSDWSWGRASPWHELVAEVFDPPDGPARLSKVEQIDIAYQVQRWAGSSGFGAGLLTLGWLGGRLGWSIPQPPDQLGLGAFRWHVRAGTRHIEVTLRPQAASGPFDGLHRIVIAVGGDHPVRRTTARRDQYLAATDDHASGANPTQLLRAPTPTDKDLLLESLEQVGRDRPYDDALAAAARRCTGLAERAG
jgi:hypothetical protein